MRVNVDKTVEVSEAERKLIAQKLGRRTADRQAIKDFLWEHGAGWKAALGIGAEEPAPVEEDLLGTPPAPAELDLLGTSANDLL